MEQYKNIRQLIVLKYRIDFGLSSFNPQSSYPNFNNTTCGTLSYIAPEILKNEPYDAILTDIWSCGVILYYMLMGGKLYNNS